MEYGKIEDFAVKENRSYLKHLPELKIENFSYEDVFAKKQKIEEEIERQREELEKQKAVFSDFNYAILAYAYGESKVVRNTKSAEEAVKRIKKSGKNPAYSVKNCSSVMYRDYSYPDSLVEKYGKDTVYAVYKYLLCNAISEDDGLLPYYICSAENTYDTKVEWFLENFDKISENSLSDGWHIPSVSEIEYVKRKRDEQAEGLRRISDDGRDEYYLGFIGEYTDFIIRTEK